MEFHGVILQGSAIYTPKQDDELPSHFHMGVPPPPRGISYDTAITRLDYQPRNKDRTRASGRNRAFTVNRRNRF